MFSLTSYSTAFAGTTPRPSTHTSASATAARRLMPLSSVSLIAFMFVSMPSLGVESTTDTPVEQGDCQTRAHLSKCLISGGFQPSLHRALGQRSERELNGDARRYGKSDQELIDERTRGKWRRARDSNPQRACAQADFKSAALPVEASPPCRDDSYLRYTGAMGACCTCSAPKFCRSSDGATTPGADSTLARSGSAANIRSTAATSRSGARC